MRRGFSRIVAAAVLAVVGLAAAADPVDYRTAKKQLFKSKGFAVEMISGAQISVVTRAQVEALAAAMQSPQVMAEFASYGYYGAVAVVPDRSITEKTMAVAAKLHSPQVAMAAAVEACNNARPKGSTGCVAVALILPNKNKQRSFTLSQHASDGFWSLWRKGKGPKYLAYSPNTHAWAIEKGEGAEAAALQKCNDVAGKSGQSDCIIGIADD